MKNNTFIVNLSKENSAKIFFSILFVYFFSLNIYQMHNQHWTAMLDQDIKIIYNSLLISSGFGSSIIYIEPKLQPVFHSPAIRAWTQRGS